MTTSGVVIGCYNHESYLSTCIDSVLAQTAPPARVIVVDDSSDDDSRSIAKAYANVGVELITCDRVGPSIVFNTGVDAIDTDVVAIISADDACLPRRLERQVQLLDRYDVDLVLGLPVIMDETGLLCSDAMAPEFFQPFDGGTGPLLRQLFDSGNFICAATATFRRTTFLSLGGFHPGLLQLQDFHLWLRWSWRRMLLSNERFSVYRKSGGSLSTASNDRRMHAERLWVYRHVFDDIPDSVVADVFPTTRSTFASTRDRELELALIYLQHPDPLIYQLGCELLLDQCGATGVDALANHGLTIQDVFAWTAGSDVNRTSTRDALIDEVVNARVGPELH